MKLGDIMMLLSHKNTYSPYREWSPEKVQKWEQLRLGYVYRQELSILSGLFDQDEETIGLDIACGSGRFTQLFHGVYVGLDHSPSMLKSAKSKGIDNLVLGDAFNLPFRPHKFNIIFFCRFIHHLDTQEVVNFFRKVLLFVKSKGCFIFDLTHKFSFPFLVSKIFRVRLMGRDPKEMDKLFVGYRKTRIKAFVLPAISYNLINPKLARVIDLTLSRFFSARSFWRVEC